MQECTDRGFCKTIWFYYDIESLVKSWNIKFGDGQEYFYSVYRITSSLSYDSIIVFCFLMHVKKFYSLFTVNSNCCVSLFASGDNNKHESEINEFDK